MYEIKLFIEHAESYQERINVFLQRAQRQSKNFEVVEISTKQIGDYIAYVILYKR